MNTKRMVLTSLFSGFLVLPFTGLAQGGDGSSDIQAEFELGAWYVSEDSFRFGKYTGLTDEGWEPVLNFKLWSQPAWDADDTTSWKFQGWRLGLDSMRLKFDYRDQGTQGFTADYREIPNNRFSDGVTPFNGIGSGMLSLPANWVAPPNSTTSDFATLDENLKPVISSWDRKRLDLSFDRVINRQWKFSVDARHETKDGLGTFGGVIGNSGGNPRAVILPRPIDWETDIMEVSFDFANSRYQFGAGFYASWFDNAQQSVTWDNPYGLRSGWDESVGFPTGQGRYSLEPENQAMQLRLYGGINFGESSRLSADLSFGSMEQDDMLFDYSVNPELEVHTPLPRTSMDAKIDTTFANLRYSVRPSQRTSLVVTLTRDERDNKTARDEWIYIGGDSQDQKDAEDARINLPYSYEKDKLDVAGTWRVARGIRVKGGFESSDYSRTYSESIDADERRVFAGVNFTQWENASISFDFSSSERDVDFYQGNRTLILSHLPGTIGDDDFENAPALRKFNQTDRDRDEYRFRADFFPTPKFNFAVTGSWFEDDYNDVDGLLGLQESDVETWSFDAGLYPREGISVTAYYTIQNYDSLQTSRSWRGFAPSQALDPANNWSADAEDDVDTWNIAFTFERPGEYSAGATEFGLDYTYSSVNSDIVVSTVSDGADPLPTLVSKMRSWSVFGVYAINARSALKLAFEKQKLTTRDFALDGIAIDGPSNTLLLGRSAPNYDLSLLMLSYIHRYE
ncbi:MAG: MtrB/PioB family decaheme-associated outer membrane protein [Xanthomonadales bacterium]|nr:MtrB/PioB family decaheme-associated outer membrane protein [Xanthomonadales bacterium]